MEKYDVFISYRRDGGDAVAGRIADKLILKGYKVFFDVESMRSGDFNEQIYKAIDVCTDMIVVLPPNGLDRCESEQDWVRLEIAYAIRNKKNIVPVMLRNFSFPQTIPDDINYLRRLQGVVASMEYFDAVISRIENLLACKRTEKIEQNKALPEYKIKLPLFLRTPRNKGNFRLQESRFCDFDSRLSWWELVNSNNLPEDEELGKLLQENLEKYGYAFYAVPYFIRRDYSNNTVDVGIFKKWKSFYDRINDICFIPRRYKDDSTNAQELMHEISELAQTSFYNDKSLFEIDHIIELATVGKQLVGGYPRKNNFSFAPLIDFCLQNFVECHMDEYKLLTKVSLMIQDTVRLYGLYEDMEQLVNVRVKFFLKYYQLISMFLTPFDKKRTGISLPFLSSPFDWCKAVRLHLLINYKYLKKHKVILSEENEKLFEKLINIYTNVLAVDYKSIKN